MKKLLPALLLLFFWSEGRAQDTTWVQTFTWDSISTRRAIFDFPQELNTKRFEKVLMYYNLKCDPATPWDNYNCGEWDYLAYSRIYDHTGVMDSVQVDGKAFEVNAASPSTQNYDAVTGALINHTVNYDQYRRSNATLVNHQVLQGNVSSIYPVNQGPTSGQRFQMIITASELTAAGLSANDDLQSLTLNGTAANTSAELSGLTIQLKSTTDTDITAWHTTGFTEVYNAKRGNGTNDDAPLITGDNEFLFYQPFTWNGTDNIIVEFEHSDAGQTSNAFTSFGVNGTGNLSAAYPRQNGVYQSAVDNYAISEVSDIDLGAEVTVAFWAKGEGSYGTKNSVFEAYDVDGNRILNVHFPWDNNELMFHAGATAQNDRIAKTVNSSVVDGSWNHWAFVKNANDGTMKIYRNGTLWHQGSGLTREIGMMHRLVIGANRNKLLGWKGKLDEFQMWNVALDAATIGAWYNKSITSAHPNFADLLVYHNFDDVAYATDASNNDHLMMPNRKGDFDFTQMPVVSPELSSFRPSISFGTGTVAGAMVTETNFKYIQKEPSVIFEYTPVNRRFIISNAFVANDEGFVFEYDTDGSTVLNQTQIGTSSTISNNDIVYYEEPFEILEMYEIGRFITPYGIGFDLGPNGFTWVYDVTDYQQLLKNSVDFMAHNTQELIDVKFAFIEGIPPRDVHNVERVWGSAKQYNYGNLIDDVDLSAKNILLSDTSDQFKLVTRITGHGHYGQQTNCCEWSPKDHKILVDGVERFTWDIWQETECGDNPNIGQGGTWPYAREGWCPGDMVKDHGHELTPYVTPGTNVSIDYDISGVYNGDQTERGGNYVMATHLVSYGAPNFQRDAAIVDILNPNSNELYSKWNPTCSNPRVIIQNTGSDNLTSCTILIWMSYGDNIEYQWTGNLGFLEKEVVEIPVTNNNWWNSYHGDMKFNAQIINVNTTDDWQDEYMNNNYMAVDVEAPETVNDPFFIWFQTNNKASENSYKLVDAQGNVIFERTSLQNNTEYKDTFDLAVGCYSVILEDSDSDGIGFWYSNQVEGETYGGFRLRKVGGFIFETFPTDFGNYHRYDFSVGMTVGTEEVEKNVVFELYPNPTDGLFELTLSGPIGEETDIQIYSVSGNLVYSSSMNTKGNIGQTQVDLSHVDAGMYIVKLISSTGVYTKEVIVK
ncbi:Por secretion system C-terminal sorting domain-containing protein [Lishizhenia tianjinensis]|uniref:Por secretion system C-terminal sorting domain-containing protein n=1 Tax=Lishizhenia tianjinensis TaxID=477690 RepID=A0A1I6YED5_9FLAO|nr:LamG-like jellyroll fold domain-containing protein [Lishizhenia tianjinensis]SFT48564.1 Por secretion system C-terminal sorting domain-containing protein [Lishizhenia tianjinensis]